MVLGVAKDVGAGALVGALRGRFFKGIVIAGVLGLWVAGSVAGSGSGSVAGPSSSSMGSVGPSEKRCFDTDLVVRIFLDPTTRKKYPKNAVFQALHKEKKIFRRGIHRVQQELLRGCFNASARLAGCQIKQVFVELAQAFQKTAPMTEIIATLARFPIETLVFRGYGSMSVKEGGDVPPNKTLERRTLKLTLFLSISTLQCLAFEHLVFNAIQIQVLLDGPLQTFIFSDNGRLKTLSLDYFTVFNMCVRTKALLVQRNPVLLSLFILKTTRLGEGGASPLPPLGLGDVFSMERLEITDNNLLGCIKLGWGYVVSVQTFVMDDKGFKVFTKDHSLVAKKMEVEKLVLIYSRVVNHDVCCMLVAYYNKMLVLDNPVYEDFLLDKVSCLVVKGYFCSSLTYFWSIVLLFPYLKDLSVEFSELPGCISEHIYQSDKFGARAVAPVAALRTLARVVLYNVDMLALEDLRYFDHLELLSIASINQSSIGNLSISQLISSNPTATSLSLSRLIVPFKVLVDVLDKVSLSLLFTKVDSVYVHEVYRNITYQEAVYVLVASLWFANTPSVEVYMHYLAKGAVCASGFDRVTIGPARMFNRITNAWEAACQRQTPIPTIACLFVCINCPFTALPGEFAQVSFPGEANTFIYNRDDVSLGFFCNMLTWNREDLSKMPKVSVVKSAEIFFPLTSGFLSPKVCITDLPRLFSTTTPNIIFHLENLVVSGSLDSFLDSVPSGVVNSLTFSEIFPFYAIAPTFSLALEMSTITGYPIVQQLVWEDPSRPTMPIQVILLKKLVLTPTVPEASEAPEPEWYLTTQTQI
ncbi:hypothetical protein NEDG_01646 [Nematocida displodere]|uniref:Uncharacterized protein n=1 Tax=Nematocida displodere TaxID=1805483 RepID=A0A177EGY9_9MICR|nr:hypothetical protein NEDG_01646 [Nematocida displodere]